MSRETVGGQPMRVLFDPAVYDMRNKGNIALLQTAVERIHGMWPEAQLEVLTVSPHLLKLYCPAAQPVYPEPANRERTVNQRFRIMHGVIPRWAWKTMFELREAAWRRKSTGQPRMLPQAATATENGAALEQQRKPGSDGEIVDGIDLLVATGAQYMSDACRDDALRVLDRFEAAIRCGIPTVMVGQGFGPMKDGELISRCRAVLPRVDLIFIREQTASPQLLSSLGVDSTRIILTGDDAVEMVYHSRANRLGNCIGVGLRVAGYTEVNGQHIGILREVIQREAVKFRTPLISLPISHSAHELDDVILHQVLSGYRPLIKDWRRFNAPQEIIHQVSRCRIVVAGTFHAIVFALAQGIPAVGLARSEMYLDKFQGLVDLFGEGLQIVRLDDENPSQVLSNAIDHAWNAAEQIRPGLLQAAQKQIEMGMAAYRRIFDLVAQKNW